MNLIGSRPTLIANLCALVLASAVTAEGAYIVHECFGYYRPQDVPAFFAPALVMFVIRNRIFSFCFLGLYAALLIQMFYQASLIGSYREACGGRLDDPLGNMVLFFLVSVGCLAVYLAIALIGLIISFIAFVTSEEPDEPLDTR